MVRMLSALLLFTVIVSGGFCQGDVVVYPPVEFVSIPGGIATFRCLSTTTIVGVQWLVNGSLLDDQNVMNAEQELVAGIGILTLTDIPLTYNGTRIRCIAEFDNGERATTNDAVILILQGHLSQVQFLNIHPAGTNISVNWTAPFTRDITGVHPDITYCVNVSTDTNMGLDLPAVCGIIETRFTFDKPASSICTVIFITVTPVNLNGEGMRATGFFFGAEIVPEVQTTRRIAGNYTLTMSATVCSAEIISTDRDTGETLTLGGSDVTIAEDSIFFTTEQFASNRHYYVHVRASNVAGSSNFYINISKHDVQNISIWRMGGITVMMIYSEVSDASGALFSFVFITDSGDVDFGRSFLLALDRNTSHNHTLPFDLYPGHYRVYVYDIEHDGTLHNGVGYPAVREELLISEDYQGSLVDSLESCKANSLSSIITVRCTFSSDTTTTSIQVIAQLSDVREVQKLYVNRSMDLTPVTITVEGDGEYQVSIFAIREGIKIPAYISAVQVVVTAESSTTSTGDLSKRPSKGALYGGIFGGVAGAAIIVLPVILFILVIVVLRRPRNSKSISIITQATDDDVVLQDIKPEIRQEVEDPGGANQEKSVHVPTFNGTSNNTKKETEVDHVAKEEKGITGRRTGPQTNVMRNIGDKTGPSNDGEQDYLPVFPTNVSVQIQGDEGSLAVSPSAGALGKQPDSEHQQIPEPIGTQQQSGNWVHPVQSSEQDGHN